MFSKFVTLLAFLAAANAGTILFPEAKIESVPVAKTSILGPSGNITKEEHLPVLTHQPAAIVAPSVLRYDAPLVFEGAPLIHQQLPLVHPGPAIPVQPVPFVNHEVPVVVNPEVPVLVNHKIPIVKAVPKTPVLIKTLPHHVPLVNPYHYYPQYLGGVRYVI